MAFDITKLPRDQLLREAFPGQEINPDGNDFARVSCTIPGCEHTHGDTPPAGKPSLDVNVRSGALICRGNTVGGTWKAFVQTFWNEERWRQLCQGQKPTFSETWHSLSSERLITERYRITPELSRRYLRSGCRCDGDPRSETVVGLWEGGSLVGMKWRLPDGARWQKGNVAIKDPCAKYALTKGSSVKLLFLGDRMREFPRATVLVCAGEKDALVAASHLNPERWAPVSGCFGEGKVPFGLATAAEKRRVVVA